MSSWCGTLWYLNHTDNFTIPTTENYDNSSKYQGLHCYNFHQSIVKTLVVIACYSSTEQPTEKVAHRRERRMQYGDKDKRTPDVDQITLGKNETGRGRVIYCVSFH